MGRIMNEIERLISQLEIEIGKLPQKEYAADFDLNLAFDNIKFAVKRFRAALDDFKGSNNLPPAGDNAATGD